jgi:hypothetical protein
MLMPDELLTIAWDRLAERRAESARARRLCVRGGTLRSAAARALGRALVLAGTRLDPSARPGASRA